MNNEQVFQVIFSMLTIVFRILSTDQYLQSLQRSGKNFPFTNGKFSEGFVQGVQDYSLRGDCVVQIFR